MRRGDLVRVALQGDYGKPRPALIIQSDLFAEHPSATVLPVTSERRNAVLFRIEVEPGADNGLKKRSQVMVDKATTVPREKVGKDLRAAGRYHPAGRESGAGRVSGICVREVNRRDLIHQLQSIVIDRENSNRQR